jgi:hypothetical protein
VDRVNAFSNRKRSVPTDLSKRQRTSKRNAAFYLNRTAERRTTFTSLAKLGIEKLDTALKA